MTVTDLDRMALARRLEAIQVEFVRGAAADSISVGVGCAAANGIGSYLNKAVGFGLDDEPNDVDLDAMEAFFSSRGIEPKVELTAFAPLSLLDRLARRGFVLRELENSFFRPLSRDEDLGRLLPDRWPEGLVLEWVDPTDEARLRIFVQASASGFLPEGQPAPEEWMATGLGFARRPGTDNYLAVVDGEVAGGAGCSTRHGLVSLYGTSVLPRFRRRGIQQALMVARLERGRALGADLADITSRPGISTERNATRLGFQLGYVRVVLVKPGPGLAPSP